MLPHSCVMLHQPHGGARGQATDIEIATREMMKTKEMNNDILSRHTGQSLERLRVDLERDYYMGPQEAIEYGVVDKMVERHSPIPRASALKAFHDDKKRSYTPLLFFGKSQREVKSWWLGHRCRFAKNVFVVNETIASEDDGLVLESARPDYCVLLKSRQFSIAM